MDTTVGAEAGSSPMLSSTSTALDCYLHLLRNPADSDLTFVVGATKEKIQCHHIILKARSPGFVRMLSSTSKNHPVKAIRIPDIEPEIFVKLLEVSAAYIFAIVTT